MIWQLQRFISTTLLSAAPLLGGTPASFVIEAEDFDHDGGQHPPATDVMPYAGGACEGLGSLAEVDYHLSLQESSGDYYRYGETPNVPMGLFTHVPQMLNRGEWDVTVNYKIGWISESSEQWFNYTRVIPASEYRAYAALSWGDTAPHMLRGELSRVVGGVGTTAQVFQTLGQSQADGTGNWDQMARVPFMAGGEPAVVALEGLTTLRYTAISGDFDYLLLVPKDAPFATVSPANADVAAGSGLTLSAGVGGMGPFTYQWRLNGQNLEGATGPTLTLTAMTLAQAGKYSVLVTGPAGSWWSDPATVVVYVPLHVGDTVVPDMPVPGAGIWQGIGVPEEQRFRFEARAGDLIFLEQLGEDDYGREISWSLTDPSGFAWFNQPYAVSWNGVRGASLILPTTGSYEIRIVSTGWSPGSYSFRLVKPARSEFVLALGDQVSEGVPGEGAGVVEDSGKVDVYAFDVDSPLPVFFWVLSGGNCGFGSMQAALFDPDGAMVFWRRMGNCGLDPATHELTKPGTYRLVVAGGWDGGYPYTFELDPTVLEDFRLNLGDAVAPGVPGAGAGQLNPRGAVDRYTFDITEPQSICLLETPDPAACLGLFAGLEDPLGNVLFWTLLDDGCVADGVSTLQHLATPGTYRLSVVAPRWNPAATGPYAFELLPTVGLQTFNLQLGQLVEPGVPTAGAGVLDRNGATDEYLFHLPTDSWVMIEDLGSTENRLQLTLSLRGPFSSTLFSEPLDGVSPGVLGLGWGDYRLAVTARDPHEAGEYRFRVSQFVNQPPVARCRDVTLPTMPGTCDAFLDVSLVDDGSYDPDGGPVYTWTAPGGTFPVGTTSVTLFVTDSFGASTSCEANVTVVDSEPPWILCPADWTTPAAPSRCSAWVNYAVLAYDPCGNETVCEPPSGSEFPLGTTTVRCRTTNPSGMTAECSFAITVVDLEPPTVDVQQWFPRVPEWAARQYRLTATDNCVEVAIFVADTASDFVAGPFQTGDGFRITTAGPRESPRLLPAPERLAAHVRLKGDARVYALDAAGNSSEPVIVPRKR